MAQITISKKVTAAFIPVAVTSTKYSSKETFEKRQLVEARLEKGFLVLSRIRQDRKGNFNRSLETYLNTKKNPLTTPAQASDFLTKIVGKEKEVSRAGGTFSISIQEDMILLAFASSEKNIEKGWATLVAISMGDLKEALTSMKTYTNGKWEEAIAERIETLNLDYREIQETGFEI